MAVELPSLPMALKKSLSSIVLHEKSENPNASSMRGLKLKNKKEEISAPNFSKKLQDLTKDFVSSEPRTHLYFIKFIA